MSTTTRTTLYTAPGRDAAAQITLEIARIEAAYLKAAKRRVPPEVLFIRSAGNPPATQLSIVAATTPDQEPVLTVLRAITTPVASRIAA